MRTNWRQERPSSHARHLFLILLAITAPTVAIIVALIVLFTLARYR